MAAGDEGLLVGRGDDLARSKGGDDRAEADDATGTDDDEVDVGAGGELNQGVRTGRERGPRRQIERRFS